jgi:murein DD-endopeptidase MepM/ murein hydrolase activator NlpD
MKSLLRRDLPIAVLAAAACLAGSAGAAPAPQKTQGGAKAYSIRIAVPNQPAGGTTAVSAPPDAVALGGSFSYPADGSVVTTEAVSASASTDTGVKAAQGTATSEVDTLSLFGGEITALQVSVRAASSAGPEGSAGNARTSALQDLVVLGQPVTPAPNLQIPLADWGTAVVLEQALDQTAPQRKTSARTTVAGLDIRLTQAHGGLPAGSQVTVAYAEASAQAEAAPPPAPPPPPPPSTTPTQPNPPPPPPATPAPSSGKTPTHAPEPKPSPFGSRPIQPVPKHGVIKLTAGPYVFPVFGPVSFTDTFGAFRADTGWHHGDDIFAPLGAPVLAVAKGVVFSVGWNTLGGNRLWLSDRQGNQFYYAHLSAYSPLAVNGARVNAGDVLGFVGNTGDAITTPYHLHFEIHPVSLLGKGYDGVIDPTSYLESWERLRNLSFSGGVSETTVASTGKAESTAPEPGAVLLNVADISTVAGLDPAAIKEALAAGKDLAVGESQAALLGLHERN